MYESKISDVKWWIYDMAGNAGWILYFACLYKYHGVMPASLAAAEIIPAILIIIGIIELVNERINRLDRILTKKRLYRGFGALTAGGVCGMLVNMIWFIACKERYCIMMLGGSFLCALFAWLLFREYKMIS